MKISKKLLLSLSAAVITVIRNGRHGHSSFQKTGVVTGTVVNFRKEPNLSSSPAQTRKRNKVTVMTQRRLV